jgi:nucleotide-binding universal stress UspA family protein
MIKRILVGLAGTTYTPIAIQRAIRLAQTHGAEVTGVTVLDVRRVRVVGGQGIPPWDNSSAIHGRRIAIAESYLTQSVREFETECKEANVKYRIVEETGDAFTKLIELARYHDLMVFGLRSILEYNFLVGDPETLLIRLVGAGVRPLIAVSEEFRKVSRVLIAYSGSMESAKAMKRFVQMQLWSGVELKIVTFHPSDDVANDLMRDAVDYCRAHGFNVCYQSNPGDSKVLLLAAANLWQADMIVMGNSTRSVLLKKVLGDTLLETLHYTQIPLFLAQ